MLILTRHPGQLITIQPHPSLRPATPIGRVFADGPIEILVARICGNRVSLGIAAHALYVSLVVAFFNKTKETTRGQKAFQII